MLLDGAKHLIGVLHPFGGKAVGEINAHPCVVKLGDAGGDIRFAGQAILLVLNFHLTGNGVADGHDLAPRHGCLICFADDVKVGQIVADVGDGVGEHVAPLAIRGTALDATIFAGNGVEDFLLVGDFSGRALHHNGGGHQLVRVKPFDLEQEEFLDVAHNFLGGARPWLERRAKAELHVIQQTDAGGQYPRLVQFIEELYARLEVAKDEGAVLFHLGQFVDFENCFGDEAECAFTTEEQVLQLHSHCHAGHGGRLFNQSLGRDHAHILHDLLDVAVLVLLHAAGIGGHPAAHGGKLHAIGFVA